MFLISLRAGGTGLNLTAADIVIHYDPWWNQAAQNQATDRAYRIGQNNPVQVYKLIAQDTIEEKILEMQQAKQSLADTVTGSADGAILSNAAGSAAGAAGTEHRIKQKAESCSCSPCFFGCNGRGINSGQTGPAPCQRRPGQRRPARRGCR